MKKRKLLFRITAILLAGGMIMLFFTGCGAQRYRVDYGGAKDDLKGAEDSYRAGAKVKFSYDLIATDTDYSFYLDDERIEPDYSESKGYVISFIMPDHDVSFRIVQKNSMLAFDPAYDDASEKEAKLSFDSFDGGGPEFSWEIEDTDILECRSEREYKDDDHEEIDGAGYTVTLIFKGLKPGITKVTVSARSPVADEFDNEYLARVGEDLKVELMKISRE